MPGGCLGFRLSTVNIRLMWETSPPNGFIHLRWLFGISEPSTVSVPNGVKL